MPKFRIGTISLIYLCLAVMFLPVVNSVEAGARRFTYVYEATTSAPGSVEFENWVTWKTSPQENSRFNTVDFRHEVEIGITDHFQASVYLADWSFREDPDANQHGFSYESSAVELIYNLTNPTTDFLGSAVYGEIRGGPEAFELESKAILQKNIGRFVFGYNATLEAEWEGEHLEERAGEFSQSLGVSYEITPSFLVGAELLHEIDFPDWSETEESVVYGGPNMSYRHGNWWATITPLIQMTNISSEVDVQTRLIFGFSF
jgi:hypothetical protein